MAVISKNKMTEIEPLLSNGKALWNITDRNPLHQNNDELHHEIVILVKVVNGAAP